MNNPVYCPGAIEKKFVTIDPEDSPITQLLGILDDGTLIDSQGKPLDRIRYRKWYDAWHQRP